VALAVRGRAGGEDREEKKARARGGCIPTDGGSHQREAKGESVSLPSFRFFSVNLVT